MAMVYGLVKQHDGLIRVRSEPGRGTTFEMDFPAALEQRGIQAPQQDTDVLPHGTETILLVEDETALRNAGARILQRLGYRVLPAGDGVQALEVIEQVGDRVGLVISDLVMPRMGGSALLERVRAQGLQVPFLLSSGYAPDDFAMESDREGPTVGFIQKPWTIAQLAHEVRTAIDGPRGLPSIPALRP